MGTFTTPALSASIRFRVFGVNLLTGDALRIDTLQISAGASSPIAFTPSLRIVGDLDLRAKATADDWTSGNRALMSNYNGDGFLLYHDASGYLHFESGGATSAIDESSALYTFVDGQTAEVRVTLDVSAGNIVWYESGVQVDTDTFTAQALDPGSNQLSVAADYLGTGLLFAGDIYYCEVRDGIAGPVVARFDAADVLAAL